MRRGRAAAATLVATAMLLVGCGAASDASRPPSATGTAGDLRGGITVFAAASLTAPFTEIAEAFEAAHPDVTVRLNFAGSSALVTQLSEGADADVFASADEANMTKAVDASLVAGAPVLFASNTLEIAVPPGNPAGIRTFADLAAPGLTLVVCAPQVPCGAATEAVATDLGVTLAPVSEESAVTDVVGKVAAGEADAGLVYRTDVAAAGDAVEGIPFDGADGVVNRYPIAVLAGSGAPDVAAAFVASVTGPDGQAVLSAAGFGAG